MTKKERKQLIERGSGPLHIHVITPELTTQASHGSVGVAVSVTALPDVAGLKLYGGLDVPHSLLTGLQMQAGEQGDAAGPGCVLHTLCPP